MLEVVYTVQALKALKRMPEADSKALVAKLERHASDRKSGDVKRLKGLDLYRLRHGDYRAVFAVSTAALDVRTIAHRRKVYR